MLQRIAAGQFLQLTDQDGLQVTDFDVSSPNSFFYITEVLKHVQSRSKHVILVRRTRIFTARY
jgi:uncharacterized protein YcgI (DUF1989 family)